MTAQYCNIPLIFITLFAITPAYATRDDQMRAGVNYCHDPEAVASNQELLKNNKDDPLIIKLVALRIGLCGLVDEKKITLEHAINIFTDEKNKAVIERSKEELTKTPEIFL